MDQLDHVLFENVTINLYLLFPQSGKKDSLGFGLKFVKKPGCFTWKFFFNIYKKGCSGNMIYIFASDYS
jgi:hypothetical protein